MGRGNAVDEAERFARLMRELKERAGLSYGALARRLHTSTSTLHRYCNGEAVPTEFAVVDRFARACGALPGEAVDLHRAWLLADARRRAAARAEPETVPEPAAGAVPDPAAGAVPDPAAGVAPEPGTGPAVVPTPGPDPAPAPAPDPALGPVVRIPRYRRRTAAVVAAGLTAGAVAVAALAASLPDRETPPVGAGATGAPRAATPAVSSGPSEAAGTPAPGPWSQPSSPPAPDDPASAPAPPPAPPSQPSPKPAPVPLTAAVRSHVWAFGCDHAYLAEQGPGSVPPPPVEADAPAWAAAQRAVHAGAQIVEVTLHGTGTGSVVLEDLEVRVAARRTPPAWNVYQMSQGCGGALTPAAFAVNLDAPRPVARSVAGNDAGSSLPAPTFPLRVSASEPVVLRVEAATTGCDCDWYLDLRWTGPSGSGTLRIDDGGRPLRTSAATGRPVYGYAAEMGRWGR
ncbi:helix-turn-helix transcriptional regulator [Streptomyces sp. NPDC048269]|uniref:helix-turn-helix domain-containing protein n=1 Tax=Streptomyces sp. NPDC048269 TaxID=3155753 RepID=UPI00342A6E50